VHFESSLNAWAVSLIGRKLSDRHSARNASVGFTDAARRAGRKLAAIDASPSNAATQLRVAASHACNPNNGFRISSDAPSEQTNPTCQPDSCQPSCLLHYQLVHRTALGSHHHPHANLPRSLAHRVGNHSVKAHHPLVQAPWRQIRSPAMLKTGAAVAAWAGQEPSIGRQKA